MVTPLKSERKKRNIPIREIALALRVQVSTINRIENGKAHPSPELANRIAKYFGNAVTRDQILFPEDYTEQQGKSTRLQKAS